MIGSAVFSEDLLCLSGGWGGAQLSPPVGATYERDGTSFCYCSVKLAANLVWFWFIGDWRRKLTGGCFFLFFVFIFSTKNEKD